TFRNVCPMSAIAPKADIWTHRVVAGRSGIRGRKFTANGVGRRVSSPPKFFVNPVTQGVTRPLLAVVVKVGGRPEPCSRTEIATDSFSVSTRTQIAFGVAAPAAWRYCWLSFALSRETTVVRQHRRCLRVAY